MSSVATDTICAVATPPGVGGLAVVRVAGPRAIEAVQAVWSGRDLTQCASHTAHFGRLVDPARGGEPLDEAVALLFRAPRSYTGLDTVELSVHGSEYVQQAVLTLLHGQGVRLAEPGEFTRLAFLSGRLDLTQAEAVADLIGSRTRAAARSALNQLRGTVATRIASLRESLVGLASLLELELDFGEEDDVEFASRPALAADAAALLAETEGLLATYTAGNALRRGIDVVILGAPNAGKSTLMNALVGDRRAIVSDIPGTTRDLIRDTVVIGDHLFNLTDTAGLRAAPSSPVERMGIDMAVDTAARASLVLRLSAPGLPFPDSLMAALPADVAVLDVATKADLPAAPAGADAAAAEVATDGADTGSSSEDVMNGGKAGALSEEVFCSGASDSSEEVIGDGSARAASEEDLCLAVGESSEEVIGEGSASAASEEVFCYDASAASEEDFGRSGLGALSGEVLGDSDACGSADNVFGGSGSSYNAESEEISEAEGADEPISVSALTGSGMDRLRQALVDHANRLTASGANRPDIITNQRHAAALARAAEALRRVLDGLNHAAPTVLVAADLRDALDSLATLTGAITTPDLLARIFSSFCIGK